MSLRPELQAVLAGLLADSEDSREVSLDALGDALGTLAVSADEIDHLMAALERAGRRVTGPRGGGLSDDLRRVVPAARALTQRLGRRPTADEIAAETGLTPAAVLAALALARVMGR